MVRALPSWTLRLLLSSSVLASSCARDPVGEGGEETIGCDRCAIPDVGTPSSTEPSDVSTSGSVGDADSSGGEWEPTPPGECVVHEDCASGYCLSYQDAPPDSNAACETPPAGMATRFTGRVLNIETFAVLPDATVDVVAALDAIVNPTGATPLVSALTDGAGRFDSTSSGPLTAAIGVVARITAPAYARSLVGIAIPAGSQTYGPGNSVHDLWAIRDATIDAWSSALSADAALAEHLPLVERGGVVAVLRNGATGMPLEGATLSPVDDASSLHIRYVDAAGTGFQTTGTASRGIAVILGAPTTGASFELMHEGVPTGVTGQVGSTNHALFVAAFDL